MSKDIDFYSLLLPEGVSDYFDLINIHQESEQLTFFLQEKNNLSEEIKDIKIESKGFYPPIVVNDFPIRGKRVLLNISRRRWINKETGEYITRKWDVVAKGTRMTEEFAAFLKGILG